MAISLLFTVFLSFLVTLQADTIPTACTVEGLTSFPFCNTSLSIEDRVQNLISLLTIDEKVLLLTARESPLNWIPRLGVPEYDWGGNCIHGIQSRCGSRCPTSFPLPNGLGATFNNSLVYEIFLWMGMELRALWAEGIGENHKSMLPHFGLNCWSPTINLGRDPRWGRMYEVPSEDPLVNGAYGKWYTLALQNGSDTLPYYDPNYYLGIATLKHFDAYSLEKYNGTTRHKFNAIVSDYMFSDSYWPAFKTSIQEGGALGVMCSYNAVNGVPSCCNDFLLNQTMRQSWGFDGYITSDSGAITDIYSNHHYATSLSQAAQFGLEATCDIDSCLGSGCHGWGDYATNSPYQEYAADLVSSGNMSMSVIDKSLRNSLTLRFKLGLFDPISNQKYWDVPGSIVNQKSTQELNLRAAQEVMTLLKNDKNTLPFDLDGTYNLGIIGPHYNASYDLLASYLGQICPIYGDHSCIPGVLSEFQSITSGSNIDVSYAEGCDVECTDTSGFSDAYNVANNSDYIVLMMGINTAQIEKEGQDRYNISLPGQQRELAETVCLLNKPTVLVLINGGIVAIDDLKFLCPSILEAWYPGFRGAQAIVNTVFGMHNPNAKMPVTMYYSNYTQISDFEDMDLTDYPGKTYKYHTLPVLYPFGWGLSYTSFVFKYDDDVDSGCNNNNKYCISITNTGSMDGSEVIFVFIYPPSDINSNYTASKLIRHVTNWQKYPIQSGDSASFIYTINPSYDLVLYDNNGDPMIVNGTYNVLFSNGVDQNLQTTYKVGNANRYKIDKRRYIK